jgi:hypothetical protein
VACCVRLPRTADYGAVVQTLFAHGLKEASAGWAITMAPAATMVVSTPTIAARVDLRIASP